MTKSIKAASKPRRPKSTPALTAPASPWPPVSHRERQREAKRNAVLQAAAQLFNERGFHATSLDDIAARLNVTKPTLYYYVKNKDEILLQCVSQGLTMMLEGIDASRAAGGKAIDQEFRRLVADGVQEGSLAPCDPKMTAFVIAGALSWIGRWYKPGGEYTPEQVAAQCIDTLLGGVLRRADGALPEVKATVPARRKKVSAA